MPAAAAGAGSGGELRCAAPGRCTAADVTSCLQPLPARTGQRPCAWGFSHASITRQAAIEVREASRCTTLKAALRHESAMASAASTGYAPRPARVRQQLVSKPQTLIAHRLGAPPPLEKAHQKPPPPHAAPQMFSFTLTSCCTGVQRAASCWVCARLRPPVQ